MSCRILTKFPARAGSHHFREVLPQLRGQSWITEKGKTPRCGTPETLSQGRVRAILSAQKGLGCPRAKPAQEMLRPARVKDSRCSPLWHIHDFCRNCCCSQHKQTLTAPEPAAPSTPRLPQSPAGMCQDAAGWGCLHLTAPTWAGPFAVFSAPLGSFAPLSGVLSSGAPNAD